MKIERLPNLNSVPEKIDWGAKVKQARLECGLSQTELARQVGFASPTGISLIEANQRGLDVKKLQQIAHVCNVPLSAFFLAGLLSKEKGA